MAGDDPTTPIEGQIFLLAAAKASVPAERLPELVREAQSHVDLAADEYDRQYELVFEGDGYRCYLAPTGHWATVGEDLGFEDREAKAVQRAHEEQFRRIGRREDRFEEFETALEIREPVVIAVPGDDERDVGDAVDSGTGAGEGT